MGKVQVMTVWLAEGQVCCSSVLKILGTEHLSKQDVQIFDLKELSSSSSCLSEML